MRDIKKETDPDRTACAAIVSADQLPFSVAGSPITLGAIQTFREERAKSGLNNPNESPEYKQLLSDYLKDRSFMNCSNLPYVLGDAVSILYGSYSEANADKLARYIGISSNSMQELLQDGMTCEEDFERICGFLQPDAELKMRWQSCYL